MSIPASDFERACASFEQSWQRLEQQTQWEDVMLRQAHGTKYLRITRHIQVAAAKKLDHADLNRDEEVIEEDDEALHPDLANPEHAVASYDIIHSPTYQVPVLYLTLKTAPSSASDIDGTPSPDEAYDILVPPSRREQLRGVGVMGALSMSYHPHSDLPAYFVHPCRTAEAMREVTSEGAVDSVVYLMTWFGLIAASVGLDVPNELARRTSHATSDPAMLAVSGSGGPPSNADSPHWPH